MSQSSIQDTMDAMVKELNQHSYNYYVLAMPTIADYEFDKKLEELSKLEKAHPEFADPDSPTLKVGGDITKNFVTVKHKWPMLSLGNTYNEQDLRDFDERIKKSIGENFSYVCELKFDGLSISLNYENNNSCKDREQANNRTNHPRKCFIKKRTSLRSNRSARTPS